MLLMLFNYYIIKSRLIQILYDVKLLCYILLEKDFDKILVQANYKLHNPNSPFLIGESTPEDKITEAKQKSWIIIDDQISFID